MEKHSIEGERPVTENLIELTGFLSSAAHVKRGMNLSRPRDKAKY